MKLDIENMLYMLIYITILISIVATLVSIFKDRITRKIEYTLIKNIFLDRLNYFKELKSNLYFSYLKYDIWRYNTLF